MNRRQLVLDTFDNKATERVPVGFWFHFAEGRDVFRGMENPVIIRKNVEGHLKFWKDFRPDFVKLMSDGYFSYPGSAIANAVSAEDLRAALPIGRDHPWIEKQVELAKTLTAQFAPEAMTFYNVFSPATLLKFLYGDGEKGNRVLADFIEEDSGAVKHALDVVAEDLVCLARRVIAEGGADGIYFSAQNVQDPRVPSPMYRAVISPGERKILSAAGSVGGRNILHVCGYEGCRNDLSVYADYEASAVNWAVGVENVGLAEGKKIFGGKAVIGGFPNGRGGLLHSGSREEIESRVAEIVDEAGRVGVIIGADCTLPADIEIDRLRWVRDRASSL
jgi:uroporphyrinogen decarboxylase